MKFRIIYFFKTVAYSCKPKDPSVISGTGVRGICETILFCSKLYFFALTGLVGGGKNKSVAFGDIHIGVKSGKGG